MKTVAIIPARGGSKRLKGKNLHTLAGKPLIVYSIEYALANASLIDRVIVSTDDPKIKETALQYGVGVIDRPEELSSDTATTVSVLKHALEQLEESIQNVILLQPTNPLRPSALLSEAFHQYKKGDFDSLMTVSPVLAKLGKIEQGKFSPFNYSLGQRSQDLKPLYYENGLLYISTPSLILQNMILGEQHLPYITDHPFSKVDIDIQEDLDYAEYLLASSKNKI